MKLYYNDKAIEDFHIKYNTETFGILGGLVVSVPFRPIMTSHTERISGYSLTCKNIYLLIVFFGHIILVSISHMQKNHFKSVLPYFFVLWRTKSSKYGEFQQNL